MPRISFIHGYVYIEQLYDELLVDFIRYRIIIDEAHAIKNRNSIQSKASADLQAHHRLCMTGTPMMNSVDELYPLLRFLRVHPYTTWQQFSQDISRVNINHSHEKPYETPKAFHVAAQLTFLSQ